MGKVVYTTDVAHCMGRACPIRDKCCRYHLYDYYRDNYVNVGSNFRVPYTEEQYNFETEECEIFKPIE